MKKYLYTLVMSLAALFGYAQAPTIEWQKSLGGSANDLAHHILQTSDGGYIVAGGSVSNNGDVSGNHGGTDVWIVKTSALGVLEWQKSYGGIGTDNAVSIAQTSDGGFIVAGFTNSADGDVTGFHGGSVDMWIVKISETGNLQWQKSLGGTGDEIAYDIKVTSDNGYIIIGYTTSNDGDVSGNHGGSDIWVVKLNASGNIQWQKTYGGNDGESGNSVTQTIDGGYIIAGTAISSSNGDVGVNHGGNDVWIVKIDDMGTLEWQKTIGGSYFDRAYSIIQNTDGTYMIAGETESNDGDVSGNHGWLDAWVAKLSATGDVLWQKSFGGTGMDAAKSIVKTSDGGYIIAGETESNDGDVSGNHGGTTGWISAPDVWVFKINSSGTLLWQKCLGGMNNEIGTHAIQSADGGYAISGYATSNDGDVSGNHGGTDFWIVKLNPEEVLAVETSINEDFSFYPNPVKDFLTLENSSNIDNVTIYDVSGKKISAFHINSKKETLNLSHLKAGNYIITVKPANSHTFSAKLIKQ